MREQQQDLGSVVVARKEISELIRNVDGDIRTRIQNPAGPPCGKVFDDRPGAEPDPLTAGERDVAAVVDLNDGLVAVAGPVADPARDRRVETAEQDQFSRTAVRDNVGDRRPDYYCLRVSLSLRTR